jgi:hypothetical protein
VADWLVYTVQYREISFAVSDAWESLYRKMEGRTEWSDGHLEFWSSGPLMSQRWTLHLHCRDLPCFFFLKKGACPVFA